jgi:integrase
VLRRLEADDDLDERRRREMRSALHSVCRALGADPSLVPAEPRLLRPKLAKVTPAAAGVSKGRWGNVRSLALTALKHVGLQSMAGRSRDPLAPEWEALRALIPDRYFQSGLSRFMSYCTGRGIAPAAVTAGTFVEFGAEVETYSLLRDPAGTYRDTCTLWNKAVQTIPGWPALTIAVPSRRRDFALSLPAFLASFQAEVEAFLTRSADPDVFSDDYSKPVASQTVDNRRRQILMAATALVGSGTPISMIAGLDMLVDPVNAKTILRFLHHRAGDKTTDQIYQIANLLKTIARHHLRRPEAHVDRLRKLCKALKPESEAFTEKNRRCMRQFEDPKKLAALLMLPQRIIAQVDRRGALRRRDAVRAALAVAVAILLKAPLRASNLAGLRLDRHLHFVGDRAFISIPAEETKNHQPIELELSPGSTQLLRRYVERYRPLLTGVPTPWLFPGENGARRSSSGFGVQLRDFIAKEAGIAITPHQFRHLAAKLSLDHDQNDVESPRRLLGHKSDTRGGGRGARRHRRHPRRPRPWLGDDGGEALQSRRQPRGLARPWSPDR